MKEEWRDISGFEGVYQVSNLGEVRSLTRMVSNGKAWYKKEGRVLKKTKTTTGYWKVELSTKDIKRKSYKVHRLVAKAFIPVVPGKELVNHKDGNPLNNRVENLEWCNQSENMYHAYNTGLMEANFTKFKEQITLEYLTDKTTNIKRLARKYKCSDSSIRKHFQNNGIETRGISQAQDKYRINRRKLAAYFYMGLKNKDIAEMLNTNSRLIAAYRYKHNKGELIA